MINPDLALTLSFAGFLSAGHIASLPPLLIITSDDYNDYGLLLISYELPLHGWHITHGTSDWIILTHLFGKGAQ